MAVRTMTDAPNGSVARRPAMPGKQCRHCLPFPGNVGWACKPPPRGSEVHGNLSKTLGQRAEGVASSFGRGRGWSVGGVASATAIYRRHRGEHLHRRNGWLLLRLRCSAITAATPPRTQGPLGYAAVPRPTCPSALPKKNLKPRSELSPRGSETLQREGLTATLPPCYGAIRAPCRRAMLAAQIHARSETHEV